MVFHITRFLIQWQINNNNENTMDSFYIDIYFPISFPNKWIVSTCFDFNNTNPPNPGIFNLISKSNSYITGSMIRLNAYSNSNFYPSIKSYGFFGKQISIGY